MGIDGGGPRGAGLFISCPDFPRRSPSACTCGPFLSAFMEVDRFLLTLRKNFPACGGPQFILYSCETETEKAMFTYLPAPVTSLWGSVKVTLQINFVIKID